MNQKTMECMEYDKILERLCSYGISENTKTKIKALKPVTELCLIERNMLETTEARKIIDASGGVPIGSTDKLELVLARLERDGILSAEELTSISGFLTECSRLQRYMKAREELSPLVSSFARSISELSGVREEIDRCIFHGHVEDRATAKLFKVRKKIRICEDRMKERLASILKNQTSLGYVRDSLISQRDGRYVIPIKSEYKHAVEGSILDHSGSNSTVFIEPAEVKKLQDELNGLKAMEEEEVFIILSTLTNLVDQHLPQLRINRETMLHYDFIFAKAKYSKSLNGRSVKMNEQQFLNIIHGVHPLLPDGVPLDLVLGGDEKALVITGPNTGGKTVALKTVGLLTMMAQVGLHVPVAEGSELCVFQEVLADIGDGQSIEQNLSTFSSHITNIIDILGKANEKSLVILDEIGSGTDPGEGMGLAIAVMEEIMRQGALLLATTHYSEIKEFAATTKGFVNGRMEFDIATLKPLYKLTIGKPGMSNAFLIAFRLGMEPRLLSKAHLITYKETRSFGDELLKQEDLPEEDKENPWQQHSTTRTLNAVDQKTQKQQKHFNIGDNVYVSFLKRTGIICELPNAKGEYGVMVMKKKMKINQKRLSLYIEGGELYPENYDYDIVFDSVANRKLNKQMSKHHVEGAEIIRS